MLQSMIEKVKKINMQIETLAHQNDWEDVLIMSKERHHYITENLDGIEFVEDIKAAKTLEHLVVDCDKKIRLIMEVSKKAIINESLDLKHKHQALNHYKTVNYS
jgi:hypothetical protein